MNDREWWFLLAGVWFGVGANCTRWLGVIVCGMCGAAILLDAFKTPRGPR